MGIVKEYLQCGDWVQADLRNRQMKQIKSTKQIVNLSKEQLQQAKKSRGTVIIINEAPKR